ncbi:hypothetical protein [Leptospira interrogans]|uniref:hypothetical protein n=1 Tax=Leptospira interrogans TaxID=173 RepID=UPI001F0D5718|nr:hypothetical protein [Leptospira interrogans]UMQ59809.1 hypothetical protein FH585_08825 [Leptospira interrogans]UNE68732.1 hypothetical protein FH588_11190 [Leptospira interrogans]
MSFDSYFLRWKVFLKVNKKEKAFRILSKIEETFDYEIVSLTYEEYWKDTSLYEANFRIYLNSKSIENAIFESLLLSQKLGFDWCVVGPIEIQPNQWNFEGVCNQPTFLSLNWANFKIDSE